MAGLGAVSAMHIEDDTQQVHPLLVLSKFAEAGIEAAGLWRPVAPCGGLWRAVAGLSYPFKMMQ